MSDEGWSPIVVPLDGTELAETGLDLGIGLAATLGASLALVRVYRSTACHVTAQHRRSAPAKTSAGPKLDPGPNVASKTGDWLPGRGRPPNARRAPHGVSSAWARSPR